VLDWIMSRRVHEYLDVAGRPVGEGRAAAFQRVHTEMQSCPYAGSRYHHAKPMNVTALRQIIPVWEDIVTMLAWLAQRQRSVRQADITTYDDLSLVTGAGIFLADFLVLRRHRPLQSREFPLLISGLYKVCLGFQLATFLGSMQERFGGQAEPARLPDAAAFHAHLEERELLIGEAEVCAGSPAMIMEAYDAMVSRRAVAADALPRDCTELAIAWDNFDLFTHHASDIWNDLVLFVIKTPQFCPQLTDARLRPDLRNRLNAILKQRADQLLAEQNGLVVDIARAAAEYCGDGGQAWRCKAPVFREALSQPKPDGLATIILQWLSDAAAADVQACPQCIADDLRSQLTPYDAYEASVLDGLNQHLRGMMGVLGWEPPGTALTAQALSQVCGRTLRDWGEPS
jgi:hypothetical protein